MLDTNWWHILYDLFVEKGFSKNWAGYLNTGILLVVTSLLVLLFDYVLWKILRRFSASFAKRTKTNFDNYAVANRLPRYIAHIFPLILALELTPFVFYDFQYAPPRNLC